MRRAAAVFTILLLSCGGGSIGNDAAPPAQHVASASCPLKTTADWQRFLETMSQDESWVETCSDLSNCDELLGVFSKHVQADVLDVLGLCASDLAENPLIARCTANFRRFVPAWMHQHVDDSYGFRQNNATYLGAQTGPDAPIGMMVPPAELLASLRDRATIEETARKNHWPYLTHDSCLGGVRTFVTVADPASRFDQWMLVGLDENANVPSPAIMSFIAVQKTDLGGRQLPGVRLHFRDYLATEIDGSWRVDLPVTWGGKCYACHGSGMRLLIPGAESADLNGRLLSYGLPDWNGTLDPADHGPPLGKALGCTGCHDGVQRGVLTVSTSEGMLRQKIVDQLSMRGLRNGAKVPDEAAMALLEREKTGNPPLSLAEKTELDRARAEHLADYQALVASRFPAWRDWVLDRQCE